MKSTHCKYSSIAALALLVIPYAVNYHQDSQDRDPSFRLEYDAEAEFDGVYLPLIAEAWKKHKSIPRNRAANPSDFKVIVSTEKNIRRIHFGPKPQSVGTQMGGGNSRGIEAVYVFDSKTGKFKVAVGGG
jgi:hypothetical protein